MAFPDDNPEILFNGESAELEALDTLENLATSFIRPHNYEAESAYGHVHEETRDLVAFKTIEVKRFEAHSPEVYAGIKVGICKGDDTPPEEFELIFGPSNNLVKTYLADEPDWANIIKTCEDFLEIHELNSQELAVLRHIRRLAGMLSGELRYDPEKIYEQLADDSQKLIPVAELIRNEVGGKACCKVIKRDYESSSGIQIGDDWHPSLRIISMELDGEVPDEEERDGFPKLYVQYTDIETGVVDCYTRTQAGVREFETVMRHDFFVDGHLTIEDKKVIEQKRAWGINHPGKHSIEKLTAVLVEEALVSAGLAEG